MGQLAATTTALSLKEGSGLHGLDYSRFSQQLINDGQRLDVDNELFPPLPSEKEIPLQRLTHPNEPVLDNAFIVRG